MKAAELRDQSTEDLNKQLLELRKEQFNLRMQAASSQQGKPDQVRKVRRNIARIKTVLNELKSKSA
jgi:large subunit ribosomal protein L29